MLEPKPKIARDNAGITNLRESQRPLANHVACAGRASEVNAAASTPAGSATASMKRTACMLIARLHDVGVELDEDDTGPDRRLYTLATGTTRWMGLPLKRL